MTDRLQSLLDTAIEILRTIEPKEGFYCAFSGGKDSIVVHDILEKSGCKFDAHMSMTSVDPPELVQFVKEHYPNVERHRPNLTMFQLIEKWNFVPTAQARYCCRALKEGGGSGRFVVTGVRAAESFRRKSWNMLCTNRNDKTKKMINIILDWTDKDVWDYIRANNMPYCCLYDEDFYRIGCIGCPMTSRKNKLMQFERYPNHRKAYTNTIQKTLSKKPSKHFGTDAELFFDWWISGVSIKKFLESKKQMTIDI